MSKYLNKLIQEVQSKRKHMSPYDYAEYLRRAYALGWEDRSNYYCITRVSPVRAFNGSESYVFKSIAEASRKVKRHERNIRRAVKNRHRCGGFYWAYIDESTQAIEYNSENKWYT